ncbi:MAG: hypothetical protein H0W59_07840 [Chloroflexia bacterium]|nr:hypothetical protein [Chloroflexia bacterium]
MVERQRGPGRRVPLIALLSADGISAIGNELTALAVPWLVLETTGSAARAGLVVAVGTAAGPLGGLFGGAIVDRLGHRQASTIADPTLAAVNVLPPLVLWLAPPLRDLKKIDPRQSA